MSIKDELQRLTGVHGHSINDVLDSADSLGGGGNSFVITEFGDIYNPSYDINISDLYAAHQEGKQIVIRVGNNVESVPIYASISRGTAILYFVRQVVWGNDVKQVQLRQIKCNYKSEVTWADGFISITT